MDIVNDKPCTPEALQECFESLFNDMDFEQEYDILGLGSSIHFIRRAILKKELSAMLVALWRLNLEKSFPSEWEIILEGFFKKHPQIEAHARKSIALFDKKGESNFMEPAAYLVSVARTSPKNKSARTLKIALRIRQLNALIFERLM